MCAKGIIPSPTRPSKKSLAIINYALRIIPWPDLANETLGQFFLVRQILMSYVLYLINVENSSLSRQGFNSKLAHKLLPNGLHVHRPAII